MYPSKFVCLLSFPSLALLDSLEIFSPLIDVNIGKLANVKPGVKRRFIPVALLGSPLSSATSLTLFTKQKLRKTRDRNQYRDISQVGDPVTCVAISNELLTKHGMYVY